MGAVSHTFESFIGNSNYKNFGSGELLMGTINMRKKKQLKTKRGHVKARGPSWQHLKKLLSYNLRAERAKDQA